MNKLTGQETVINHYNVAFYAVGLAITAVIACIVFGWIIGCTPQGSNQHIDPMPEAEQCLNKRTRLQLECIDLYEAGADITKCRNDVQKQVECSDSGATHPVVGRVIPAMLIIMTIVVQ